MKLRIGARIFLGMLAILVVSLAGVPVSLKIIRGFGETELLANLERASRAFEEYLSLRYRLLTDKATALADVPYLKATLAIPGLDAQTARPAAERIAQVSDARQILLFDHEGNLITGARPLPPGSDLHAAPDVVARVRDAGSSRGVSTVGGEVLMVCWVPVVNDGAMEGILMIGEPLDQALARSVRVATGCDTLFAIGGRVLADTLADTLAGRDGAEPIDAAALTHLRSEGHQPGRGMFAVLGGEERAIYVAGVPDSPVDVVLSRPTSAVTGAYENMLRSLGWCLLSTIAITLLLSPIIARRIAHPIRILTEATHRMAEDQVVIDVEAGRKDEIGVLARSVTTMAKRILEQKATEIEILAMRERALAEVKAAEAGNRLKNEFLANISHELRTPLHAVISFAQLGRARHGTADLVKLGRYFDQIDRSAQILLTLVNDLLDLAKLEAGGMAMDRQSADAAAIVKEVVEELQSMLEQAGVGVDATGIQAPIPATVDVKRIKQVIRNLLANALRFTRRGTSLEIHLESRTDGLRFRVRDFGPGIPDAELESIFGKFVQSSRTKDAGGTGLGLPISRKIVEAHGGRVWAENHPETGAVFTVEIPSPLAPAPSVAMT